MMQRASAAIVAPVAVAAAGAALYAIAFFPGAMTFDGAYQWWQARGGETSNVHAPAMTWLWRASNALTAGPALLFVLQLALFWGGLLLTARQLPQRAGWRVAFVALCGAAPICWTLFSAVLSDTLLLGVLCCAAGLAPTLGRGDGHRRFALMVLLVLAAVLLRKNAAPAVLPLLIVALSREFRLSFWRCVGVACIGVLVLQGASALLDRSVERRVSILPSLALWDLAAISIDTGEVLLPAASHGPDLTVEDLSQAFEAYACPSLFARTRAGVIQPALDEGDPLNGEIRTAWLRAIVDHPLVYAAHRLRLTRALFGAKPRTWPRELIFFSGEYQYRDNPPVSPNTNRLNAAWLGLMESWRTSAALAAWPYLLLGLAALIPAWRRRQSELGSAALAVLGSGLLYALPLLLIAASAELRYLGWSCVAALIGGALALAAPRPAARALTLPRAATTVRAPS